MNKTQYQKGRGEKEKVWRGERGDEGILRNRFVLKEHLSKTGFLHELILQIKSNKILNKNWREKMKRKGILKALNFPRKIFAQNWDLTDTLKKKKKKKKKF